MEGIAFDQYQTFHCVGSDCPYTCCGGYWRIDVDEETDRFYQSCDGEFGEYLNKNIIRGGNGPAIMNLGANGRCAMLDTRGLCSIQIAYGSERLCQTCKLYPRIGWAQEGMNIRMLKGTVLTDMQGMAGFEFPVIFQRALDYMQDDTANLAGFVEYLKEIDSKQQQREFENLLVALLPGKYISEFAEHDLYRQAAYVLILAQLYRIFSALGHAGGTESENEIRGPLLVSYICRFFDHTSQEYKAKMAAALKEEHLTDMEFMLRLVG